MADHLETRLELPDVTMGHLLKRNGKASYDAIANRMLRSGRWMGTRRWAAARARPAAAFGRWSVCSGTRASGQ
jgi:hypothetical protein